MRKLRLVVTLLVWLAGVSLIYNTAVISPYNTVVIPTIVRNYLRAGSPRHCTQYNYTLPNGTTLVGQPLSDAFLPTERRTKFIRMEDVEYNFMDFTVVTACSVDHFKESTKMIESVQTTFPNTTIIFYDLGLTADMAHRLKVWKNVEYRYFNMLQYPRIVQELYKYSFKPLIIFEVIQEKDALFWMDASVRVNKPKPTPDYWKNIYNTAARTGGVVQFGNSGKNIFQSTHPGTFRFLPVDEKRVKKTDMQEANSVLYYATSKVYRLLRFYALCGLNDACIAPRGSSLKRISDKPGEYNFHRYDQSVLSILLANQLNYTNVQLAGENYISIDRLSLLSNLLK